jgi:hypothetical protein
MWSAMVVIPLAAMAFPIALILAAVLFDALFLGWWLYRMWHDEWAERVAAFLFRPIRSLMHLKHPVQRPHPR